MKNLKIFLNGPGLVILTVMWEFFSYYGTRTLLVLYVTQKLNFSDANAYALYGGYTSLIFVSPLIGGYIADRYLGFKRAAIVGAALIVIGHLTLSITGSTALYIGLSVLICGVGFFKTNAICFVGDFYRKDRTGKASAYSLYYVGANIGATLGPIATAYAAEKVSYSLAFVIAAFGMLIGLFFLYLGRTRIKDFGNPTNELNIAKRNYPGLLILLVAFIFLTTLVLKYDIAGYILLIVGLIAFFYARKVYGDCDKPTRKGLWQCLVLTLFGTLFWVFDMQGGSSITLFILRNINREGIPTAMFQSINPFIIVIFGVFVAWFWQKTSDLGIQFSSYIKITIGILLLTLGISIITLAAKSAEVIGQANVWYPILGLSLIGAAELFIDPIILTELTRIGPQKSMGVLTGIYYLFVGALANFLAAKVAGLTALPSDSLSPEKSAMVYADTFEKLIGIGVMMIVALLVLQTYSLLKPNTRPAGR